MKYAFKRIHLMDGIRHGVVFYGRRRLQTVVITDSGVRVIRIKPDSARLHDVPGYTPQRAVKRLHEAGRNLGITQQAAKLLQRIPQVNYE